MTKIFLIITVFMMNLIANDIVHYDIRETNGKIIDKKKIHLKDSKMKVLQNHNKLNDEDIVHYDIRKPSENTETNRPLEN